MKPKRGRPRKEEKDKVVRFVVYLSPHGANRLLSLKGWQWENDTVGKAIEFAVEKAFENTNMGDY